MEQTKKREHLNPDDLHKTNLWAVGVRFRGSPGILGTNPEGNLLYRYPEKLQLPHVVWVTRWGIAVDRWVFIGFGLVDHPGLDHFTGWLTAWIAERAEVKPVVGELINEVEHRARHLEDEAFTREARGFFFS